MLSNIGIIEILVLTAAAAVAAGLFLPRLKTSSSQSRRPTVAMGSIAIPAFSPVTTGRAATLAELFGLGRYGIRWRHVLVLAIGIWASANLPVDGDLLPELELFSLLWPVFFLFAAVVALSFFQSTAAIAVGTGLIYALLMTTVRLAMDSQLLLDPDFAVRGAALSLSWTFLTMIVMQVAISGRHPWTRMFLGLSIVSLIQQILITRVYLGSVGLDSFGMDTLVPAVLSDAVWVLTFWYASEGTAMVKRRFGSY